MQYDFSLEDALQYCILSASVLMHGRFKHSSLCNTYFIIYLQYLCIKNKLFKANIQHLARRLQISTREESQKTSLNTRSCKKLTSPDFIFAG